MWLWLISILYRPYSRKPSWTNLIIWLTTIYFRLRFSSDVSHKQRARSPIARSWRNTKLGEYIIRLLWRQRIWGWTRYYHVAWIKFRFHKYFQNSPWPMVPTPTCTKHSNIHISYDINLKTATTTFLTRKPQVESPECI